MRTKCRVRDTPTFYLDQSTLSEAFVAGMPGSSLKHPHNVPYGALVSWIERVATEANLCLSIVHRLELAAWQDVQRADAVVLWLDELPIVWMRKLDAIRADEEEYWLQVSLGLNPAPVDPFADTMAWSTNESISTPDVTVVPQSKSLPHAIASLRQMNPARGREVSSRTAENLRADRRQAATREWSSEEQDVRIRQNRRVALRKLAGEAHDRLMKRGDTLYLSLGQTRGEVIDPFVEFVEHTPAALPTRRVMDAFGGGFLKTALATAEGSRKDGELAGSANDALHAAFGAYCDIFTCDGLTSSMLGEIRTQIGRPRQLSARESGSPERFVADLMDTWK